MADKTALLNFRQNLNQVYGDKAFADRIVSEKSYYEAAQKVLGDFCKDDAAVLEMAHTYSPLSECLPCAEKFFLTDDAFSAMLAYHRNPNVSVYHLPFSAAGFDAFANKEKFDCVFSDFGLFYGDIFALLRPICALLKCGGYFAAVVPSFWFLHDALNDDETLIYHYAKTTDKKWLFPESLDETAKDNGCIVTDIVQLDVSRTLSRASAAWLSGLTKLYHADCTGDISITETVDIPENVKIRPAVVILRKEKKTFDKDNIFNI